MIDTPELEEYIKALPTHNFPTEKPADEPFRLDVVKGWWGTGVVTDVAETQGSCRVQTERGKCFWVENSEITHNVTEEKAGR